MAKGQGHSQSQLGISCSDRGPITLDISGKFNFIFNMDSLEKIGFRGSGARSCSSRGDSIIQQYHFLNPYGHDSEGTDGQGKFLKTCLRKWVVVEI